VEYSTIIYQNRVILVETATYVIVEQVVLLVNNQELSSIAAQPLLALSSWRIEPEIDGERQHFLCQRLAIVPDVQKGIYPFRDVRLSRADVEWLLANHEQKRGPVDWSDIEQRDRQSLDLRGADLRHVNLQSLPLAGLRGGLTKEEWNSSTLEQHLMAGIHLERAALSEALLQGAVLRGTYLNETRFRGTHLEEAVLFQAHLEGAYLRTAHLEGANMESAHLEGAYLRKAYLVGTDLRDAFFDSATNLEKIVLADAKGRCALLADVHWGDVNLSVIDWQQVKRLGDENLARIPQRQRGSIQDKQRWLNNYRAAIRANRQLANSMRAQGINEEAIPFAYRAQVLQRRVLWRHMLWGRQAVSSVDGYVHDGLRQTMRELWQRMLSGGSYIFSWFLDILAGYGYKPGRSLLMYVLMITIFAIAYHLLGSLSLKEAIIFSITSFHGRGFLPGPFTLRSPVTAFAAIEAVVGLFIEISFIATFTQRFFGR